MPLHLVGIARREQVARHLPVETIPESGSSPVYWVAHETLAAAVVHGASAGIAPLELGRALSAIHRHIGILPVRYGVILADEQALCAFLGSRCQEFCRDLDRLEGMSELGLRIELAPERLTEDLGGPSVSGVAGSDPVGYLALRRAHYERRDRLGVQAERVAEAGVAAVKGLYRQWRWLPPERPGIVRLTFLVERGQAHAFARRIETLRPETLGARCACVGPWPPYSFV